MSIPIIKLIEFSGGTPPYSVTISDIYGNNSLFLTAFTQTAPPSINIEIPTAFTSTFLNVPMVKVKILDTFNCELFNNVLCTNPIPIICCPVGYVRTNEFCFQIEAPISGSSGTTTTFTSGDTTFSAAYAQSGTVFYEDVTFKKLPLTFNNDSQFNVTTSALTIPIGNKSILVDGENFTPSLCSSTFGFNDVNISGNPIQVLLTASTAPWRETRLVNNVPPFSGVMNNAGIRTSSAFINQWVGFKTCLEVPTTDQYHLMLGADDSLGLRLNGEWFIKRLNNINTSYGGGVVIGLDGTFTRFSSIDYKEITLTWNHCIPLTLSAGTNVFEFFTSDVFGAPTSAVFEIYSGVTTATLTGITNYNDLAPYTAFTSKSIRGTVQTIIGNSGDDYGIYCDVDFTLLGICDEPYCYKQIPFIPC